MIYDPMTSMATTTSEISEWSMQGVVFEARDIHDSSNYSYAVNFIVKGVEFTAQRVDEGSVEFGDSAVFSGTGLPDSVVTARLVEGRLRLNDTIVGQDGLWSMEITSAVLDNDGTYEIFFEQDGQEIGNGDGNKITLVKGETASEGVKSWVWITIAIVAVVITWSRSSSSLNLKKNLMRMKRQWPKHKRRKIRMLGPKQGPQNRLHLQEN